jgi:hypothetical protein
MQLEVYSAKQRVKHTGGPLIERRRAKRFQVDWPIRVERGEGSGVANGILRNISSDGALLELSTGLSPGTQLDVYIKLPLMEKKWMKYPASVVRTELGFAAVKFNNPRPEFEVASGAV